MLILVFILGLITSLIATYWTRRIATVRKIGTFPDERMVHTGFIPHLGGIGIFSGFVAGLLVIVPFDTSLSSQLIRMYGGILVASTLVFLMGVYDDLYGLNAPKKFTGQLIAAGIVILMGCKIQSINNPFGQPVDLGILSLPVTFLWLVGITNAVNLLDGLDGLAGGVSLIVTLTIIMIAWQVNDYITIAIGLALVAGILGFLRFNYHPASIFMGDTGSLFLGFIIASLSMRAFEYQEGTVSILGPVIALGVPIGDTSVAFFRRLNKGYHPFKPDKDHLHHRLIYLGLSHRQAVHTIYLISILFGITSYFLSTTGGFGAGILLIGILLITIIGLKRLGYLEAQKFKTIYGDETVIKARKEIAPLSMRRFWHKSLLVLIDIMMINISLLLTWWVRFSAGIISVSRPIPLSEFLFPGIILLITAGWILLFILNDLYNMNWDVSRFDQIQHIAKVILFGILILFVITIDFARPFSEGKIALIIYGLILAALVSLGRMLLITIEKKLQILEYAPHNTLLVGTTEKAKKLLRDISKNPHLLYNVLGYVTRTKEHKVFYGLNSLGTYENIPELIRNFGIEEIIIAINERSRDEILNIVSYAENMKVSFKIIPQIFDVVSGHKTLELIGHPLIKLFPDHLRLWQKLTKYLLDRTGAVLVIALLSPVWMLVFLIQLLRGIHPVLKIENMVGKNGRIFGKLNFTIADRRQFFCRLLYLSHFYKLPETVNILLGNMSFVGPRPETPELVSGLKTKIKFYNRRFQVLPGLTGWAQVRYRYDDSLKSKREQFKQDLYYLENISLTFDLRIILRSLLILIIGKKKLIG